MAPDTGIPAGAGSTSAAAQQAFDQALDAHDRGMLEKAETLYRQAVAADPRMTIAHNNLGMVLIDLSRFEEAVVSLRRSLDLNPSYAEAYNNLGFACRKLGRDAEAADAYEHFLQLSPDVDDAPKIRAWISKVRPAAPAASPAPTPAVAAGAQPSPADGDAAGDMPVLPASPTPPALERTILDPNKTMAELPPLADEQPPPTDAAAPKPATSESDDLSRQADAEAAAFFGDSKKAGGASQAAEPDSEAQPAPSNEIPAEIQDLYTQALTKFQDGVLDEAATLCQTILDKCPGHFHTLILMGRAILGSRDFTRATTIFQKAVEARPNDPEAFFFLGQSYEKRGLIEEAQDAYKRCLQAAPDGPRAKRLAKWLERDQGPSKVAGGAGRCEFCLRAVPEQDLGMHDNRRCCKDCQDTLGAKTADAKKPAAKPDRGTFGSGGAQPRRRRTLLVAAVAVGVLALGAAGAYAAGLHKHPDLLKLLGMAPPAPPVPVRPVNSDPNGSGKVQPAAIAFASCADILARPLETVEFTVTAQVTWPGPKAEMPANADPVRMELVEKPEGAEINGATGVIRWTPGAAAPLEVPSTHRIKIRASCGQKSAETSVQVKIDFPVGRPRELDLRLTDAYRASGIGLALADLDGDGQADLAAACGTPVGGSMTLALSAGIEDAAAQPRTVELPLTSAPIGLSAADVDGDGRADLGWLDWVSGRADLLRGGRGATGLRAGQAAVTAPFSDALALADLDGDGRYEFAVANRRESKLYVARANGTIQASAALPPATVPVVMAEVEAPDGKGRPWLMVAMSGGSNPGQALFFELTGRDGTGGALEQRQKLELPAGLVIDACTGDFTGNGRRSVALLFGGAHGGLALVGPGNGKQLAITPAGQAGELPLGLAAANLNGDGRTDLLVSVPGSIRLLLSNGHLFF